MRAGPRAGCGVRGQSGAHKAADLSSPPGPPRGVTVHRQRELPSGPLDHDPQHPATSGAVCVQVSRPQLHLAKSRRVSNNAGQPSFRDGVTALSCHRTTVEILPRSPAPALSLLAPSLLDTLNSVWVVGSGVVVPACNPSFGRLKERTGNSNPASAT